MFLTAAHGFFLYSSYLLLKILTVEDSLKTDGIKFHLLVYPNTVEITSYICSGDLDFKI